MSKSKTLFITQQLVKQIEEESLESLMWFISCINRCLLVDENMSLLEFKNLFKEVCPERFADFKRIMNEKELSVIG
jgi:hypothetical protein